MSPKTITSQQATTQPPTTEPPAAPGPTGGPGLVRTTVNLTQRSHQELLRLAQATGLSKTDVINRALQIYGLIENLLDQGNGKLHITHANGNQESIYIL